MRKHTVRLLAAIVCAAALAGCAKKELVRSEEMTPSPESGRAAALPADHAATGGMVGEKIMQEEAVREEPAMETAGAPPSAATLETVYFDFDSYLLSPEARDTLVRNAGWLRKNSAAKVRVEGHCDERGSGEYNLALGEKRGVSAMNYVKALGVPEERLSVISYGEEKSAANGHDEAAWAKNRRAEFVIVNR